MDKFVWDGTLPTTLKMGDEFLYKDELFVVGPCTCGCDRLSVFHPGNTENEVDHLTIRLRGDDMSNQGRARIVFLMQSGKTFIEIADACEAGKAIGEQIDEVLKAWQKEAGINQEILEFADRKEFPAILLSKTFAMPHPVFMSGMRIEDAIAVNQQITQAGF